MYNGTKVERIYAYRTLFVNAKVTEVNIEVHHNLVSPLVFNCI